jgi:acyl-CoA thioesterase I
MRSRRPLAAILRSVRTAWLVSAGLLAATHGALSQWPARSSPAETCLEASRSVALGVPLRRTSARIKAGDTLRIVAVGSSSTTGLWVLSSDATYPEVMRRELARLRSGLAIEIINSGRIGDTISGTLARFERDVLAYRPDLVVWQLGTNDVAWGGATEGLKESVTSGVRLLKASGADVILMDLQYSPLVLASSNHSAMQAIIADTARQERVGLFSRFALMRRAIDAGLTPNALVSWDGLHHSAAGYECVGRALARAVHAGVR